MLLVQEIFIVLGSEKSTNFSGIIYFFNDFLFLGKSVLNLVAGILFLILAPFPSQPQESPN